MKKVTLWELLNTEQIVIPIIQRDYAQGRTGKEYVRKAFLSQIKTGIEANRNNEGNKILNLDFVYGNTENNSFKPLDGQQRITTLWLLHWYLSLRSKNLNNDGNILNRFTYKTRESSSAFCKELCKAENFEKYDENEKISEFIKKQTWFYSEWLLDPTISAMLRTLSGDSNDDDNIEVIFKNSDFGIYREQLINNVKFLRLDIGAEKLSSSDALYIKMNARGKCLTNFENFKADLIDQLKKWESNDFNSVALISQIDVTWTQVFWNSTRESLGSRFNGEIDQSFFSFFNRYVLNEICLKPSNNATDFKERLSHEVYEKSRQAAGDADKKKLKDVWNFYKLYGRTGNDDSMVIYEGFDLYEDYLTCEHIKHINTIMDNLSTPDIYKAVEDFFLSVKNDDDLERGKKSINFIPKYSYGANNNETITLNDTTLKERIYFYAVCQFLSNEKSSFDKESFRKWMRVVKNITENAGIDSVPSMITCLQEIQNISNNVNNMWKIYEFLANDFVIEKTDTRLRQQLKEEVEKAIAICNKEVDEKDIINAEDFGFFNGTIRFLYRDKDNKPCWSCFPKKFEKAQKLFTNDNKVSLGTIKSFLNLFEKFEDIYELHLFTTIGYHNRNSCWKKDILCNNVLTEKVHSLLAVNDNSSANQDKEYEEFIQNKVKRLTEDYENYKFRCREYNELVAIQKTRKPEEGLFVGEKFEKKYSILSNAAEITMNEVQYNFGIDIEFKWQGNQYCWSGDSKIYKMVNKKYIQLEGQWKDEETLLSVLENDKLFDI